MRKIARWSAFPWTGPWTGSRRPTSLGGIMILVALASLLACEGDKDDDSDGGEADADTDTDADTDADADTDTDTDPGPPVEWEDITGRTYDFDFVAATWIEPSFGATLFEYLDANHMLVM